MTCHSVGVASGARTGAMTAKTGGKTTEMTGVSAATTGETTVATGVPDPGCFADNTKTRSA